MIQHNSIQRTKTAPVSSKYAKRNFKIPQMIWKIKLKSISQVPEENNKRKKPREKKSMKLKGLVQEIQHLNNNVSTRRRSKKTEGMKLSSTQDKKIKNMNFQDKWLLECQCNSLIKEKSSGYFRILG